MVTAAQTLQHSPVAQGPAIHLKKEDEHYLMAHFVPGRCHMVGSQPYQGAVIPKLTEEQ